MRPNLRNTFVVSCVVITGCFVLTRGLRGGPQDVKASSAPVADEPQKPTDPVSPNVIARPPAQLPPTDALQINRQVNHPNQPAAESTAFPFAKTNPARVVSSSQIVISWSRDNDELRGFSVQSGEWRRLKIEKLKTIKPVLGEYVAAVRVNDSVAAFSGKTGTWDLLKLRPESSAVPSVSSEVVQVSDGDELYTFAASKGAWTSPTDPNFLPRVTAYAIGSIAPEEAKRRIEENLRGKNFRVVADEKTIVVNGTARVHEEVRLLLEKIDRPSAADNFTNLSGNTKSNPSLFRPQPTPQARPAGGRMDLFTDRTLSSRSSTDGGHRETREFRVRHMKAIEALMRLESELQNAGIYGFNIKHDRFEVVGTKQQLDRIAKHLKEIDKTGVPYAPAGGNGTDRTQPAQPELLPRSIPYGQPAGAGGRAAAVLGLAGPGILPPGVSRPDAEENKSLQLAQKLRSADSVSDSQKNELRDLVTQSLDARLKQQEQQVTQLKEKLAKIEKTLIQRRQSKARIIERRVEELLDPTVDWETISRQSDRPTGNPFAVTQGAARSAVVPPVVPPVAIGAPASTQKPSRAALAQPVAVPATSVPATFQQMLNDLIQRRRDVDNARRRLESLLGSVKEYSDAVSAFEATPDQVDAGLSKGVRDKLQKAKSESREQRQDLTNLINEWKLSWNHYLSQLRIREFGVEEEASLHKHAEEKLQRTRAQFERGLLSKTELEKMETEARVSGIRVQQAGEQLTIAKSVAKESPHLNPETMNLDKLLSSVPELQPASPGSDTRATPEKTAN